LSPLPHKDCISWCGLKYLRTNFNSTKIHTCTDSKYLLRCQRGLKCQGTTSFFCLCKRFKMQRFFFLTEAPRGLAEHVSHFFGKLFCKLTVFHCSKYSKTHLKNKKQQNISVNYMRGII
jgi:hypothetical protein